MRDVAPRTLHWQSKLILLLVLPYTTLAVVYHAREWITIAPAVAVWVIGVSALLGLAAWKTHAATAAAAATGAVLTADVTFATVIFPYHPWQTALLPMLALLLLTTGATRYGRGRKERLGTAEQRRGRGAAQVTANLGMSALAFDAVIQACMLDSLHLHTGSATTLLVFAVALAAMAEATADTLSSEIGQVLGGQPRMITTLRRVAPGTDGGITFAGTATGIVAAGAVALIGGLALRGGVAMIALSWAGGVFGLFFDSLLGATLERRGWLNNDAVNFLSTSSAAAFALIALFLLQAIF